MFTLLLHGMEGLKVLALVTLFSKPFFHVPRNFETVAKR